MKFLFQLLLVLLVSSCAPKKTGPEYLTHLNQAIIEPTVLSENVYEAEDSKTKRTYHDVVLDAKEIGECTFTVSLPKRIPKEGVPCVVVLAGFVTGKKSLDYIPEHGDYALIAFEYPYKRKRMGYLSAISSIPGLRKAAFRIPPQITTLLRWAQKQPWASDYPPSLLGVSLGAMFVPVTYHLAQSQNLKLSHGLIAYGGADIYTLTDANLRFWKIIRAPIATLAVTLLRPLDPQFHLPHMQGEFLIINGENDKRIPDESAKLLQELTPEPKTVIKLDTEHIDVDNIPLVHRVAKICIEWLQERLS